MLTVVFQGVGFKACSSEARGEFTSLLGCLSQSLESVTRSRTAHRLGGGFLRRRGGRCSVLLLKSPSPPERRSGGETPSGAPWGAIPTPASLTYSHTLESLSLLDVQRRFILSCCFLLAGLGFRLAGEAAHGFIQIGELKQVLHISLHASQGKTAFLGFTGAFGM
jgi:hypothetical protein